VQAFRNNTLPTTAPNGGTYKIAIVRGADVASQAYYTMLIAVVGGNLQTQVDVGQISAYVGGDGAGVYAADNAQTGVTGCNTTAATVRGAFGAVCVNLPIFAASGIAFDAPRPAAIAFITTADLGTTDSRYLWRTLAPTGSNLNSMTVDLGMMGTSNMVFAGTGGIAMNAATAVAGTITGPSGLTMRTAGGPIVTNGGAITTGTSAISATGGGDINLSNGSLINASRIAFKNGGSMDGSANPLNIVGMDISSTGTLNAVSLYAQSFIYQASDRKLKKDIETLSTPLDMLLQIHGVSYRLKATDERGIGVIAQDVQKVYPELVRENSGHLVVNYEGLIGPLIESVRELKLRNDRLQSRVDALEQELHHK